MERHHPISCAEQAQGVLAETQRKVQAFGQTAQQRAREAADASSRCLRENPIPFVAAAFAAGVVAGWLLTRRTKQEVSLQVLWNAVCDQVADRVRNPESLLPLELPSRRDVVQRLSKTGKKLKVW